MSKHNFTRGHGLLESFLAKKRAEKAKSLIDGNLKKGSILDIGCGSFPYFLTFIDFKNKYGVDPSLSTTESNKLILKKIDVAKTPLPFADNFFETVTMLAVFEHIDYQRLTFVLKEVKRVLKRNGIFIITTPSPWSDKLLHNMARFGLISSEEIHDHKHHYSKNRIEGIIRETGFKKENINSGYFEFGMNMWFTATK